MHLFKRSTYGIVLASIALSHPDANADQKVVEQPTAQDVMEGTAGNLTDVAPVVPGDIEQLQKYYPLDFSQRLKLALSYVVDPPKAIAQVWANS